MGYHYWRGARAVRMAMGMDRPFIAAGLGMLKLLLFAAELFLLLVFCNGLFLVPEPYFGKRGLYTAIAAVLASGVALAGGKISIVASANRTSPPGKIFTTFPVVFCIVILTIAV